MTPWLSIVGIGEDGLAGLSPAARALVEGAETLAGGVRHLAMVADTGAERLSWEAGLLARLDDIAARRGHRVCVLASGDPMWFGVGATIARRFDPGELTILPHPSAFSLAAARLGWPLHEVVALSVHARPLEAIGLHLHPGARLLVLTADGRCPGRIAALLRGRGYGPSIMTVFEHLGGAQEQRRNGLAADWAAGCAALNTVAIECIPGPDALRLPMTAGLPDDAYLNDGQLTKREVRAATLAALAPEPGALLWDVGAGCGSVAIEWMRAGGRAVAIERSADHVDLIARNCARLGVPALDIRRGEAPAALAGLPVPAAIFVGGGIAAPDLLEACWAALAPGGRLVANVVTAEGEAVLYAWLGRHPGEMIRLAVTRLDRTGRFRSWKPAMPVTQYAGVKP